MYCIDGNRVYDKFDLIITLDCSILDLKIHGPNLILLLDSKNSPDGRNIVSYDLCGRFKWRIECLPKFHSQNYFTSLYVIGKSLYSYNENGTEVEIDSNSGKLLAYELIK